MKLCLFVMCTKSYGRYILTIVPLYIVRLHKLFSCFWSDKSLKNDQATRPYFLGKPKWKENGVQTAKCIMEGEVWASKQPKYRCFHKLYENFDKIQMILSAITGRSDHAPWCGERKVYHRNHGTGRCLGNVSP